MEVNSCSGSNPFYKGKEEITKKLVEKLKNLKEGDIEYVMFATNLDEKDKARFDRYEPILLARSAPFTSKSKHATLESFVKTVPKKLRASINGTVGCMRDIDKVYEDYYSGKADITKVESTIKAAIETLREKFVVETNYDEKVIMPHILEATYEKARAQLVGGAAVASGAEGRKMAVKYKSVHNNEFVYYNADYHYKSEEMKDKLIDFMNKFAEENDVKCVEFKRSFPPEHPCRQFYESYNTYINATTRGLRGIANMLDETMDPPKGFKFFYIDDGGEKMYPGRKAYGVYSEEEVFEMLKRVPKGYPPAPMKSADELFDGILEIKCGNWSFMGRVPVRYDGYPVSLSMMDVVKNSKKPYPREASKFMNNWDFFRSCQEDVYYRSIGKRP